MQPTTFRVSLEISRPSLAVESLSGAWQDPVSSAAWQHAIDAYPQESVGVVRAGAYERLDNIAADPEHHVELDPAITATLTADTILVHSHPDGLQCPSAADMRVQAQLGMPFIILPIGKGGPLGKAFMFGHTNTLPLLGRPFRHGVLDCYALCRDFYREEMGLALADFPRDWEWWSQDPPLDLYAEGYATQGFTEIPLAETQPGDAILFALRSRGILQHAAIVIDAHRILHHPAALREFDATRLSTLDLRSIWIRFAVKAVRPPSPT